MMTTFCGPASSTNWRYASRNGNPSMSPVVPPISVINTSHGMIHPDEPGAAARLDLVGDMRNYLHRLAEIIAAPFPSEHRFVDLPLVVRVGWNATEPNW